MGKFIKTMAFCLLLAMVAYAALKTRTPEYGPELITYGELLTAVENANIADNKIQIDGETAAGKLRDSGKDFIARLPQGQRDETTIPTLKEHGINIDIKKPFASSWFSTFILSILLPLIFFVALWMFIMRAQAMGGNQAMAFGRSRARRHGDNLPKVTFEDVAGIEEAKEELKEVIDFLKHPEKFQALGAKIPKGVLLLGPPGSGKTLLARAIAGEAGVPFFHISGSDFVEMFVGVGASRVRDLFEQAKVNRPCIVFIDEIDAVGRQRGAGLGGGHDEREQTLNQLLVEMDGFDPNLGVILIAATNRPDVLDPALLRPGRFDRRIVVDNPDARGREEILKVHTKGKPLAEGVDLELLARRTPGFSGADLANMVNEAALLAARRDKNTIDTTEFQESVERVVAGPERRSRIINDKEKKVLAFHEAGHALVSKLLPNADPVHKVTILPRGMALGYTMQVPLEDHYITSRSELIDNMTILLGGRVAEEIVFAEATTGAENDLERVTDIARRMVCEFGMSDKLGPVTLGRRHGPIFLGREIVEDRNYSEEVASAIDREVRSMVDDCFAKARELLTANREILGAIVEVLLNKETIDGEELSRIVDNPAAIADMLRDVGDSNNGGAPRRATSAGAGKDAGVPVSASPETAATPGG